MLRLGLSWLVIAVPAVASAQRFGDATDRCFGTTAEWTNRAEIADLDGDGQLDVVLANGGDDATAGTAAPVRAWRNLGAWGTPGVRCTEITADLGLTGLSRVVRAVDVDGDGDQDLIAGGAYQTQLRLLLRGTGGWIDGTSQLPQQLTSAGDVEAGDVDGDGDLDLVIAEWGSELPTPTYPGGRTRLYLNNGSGTFTDATATRMPDVLVRWSKDVEVFDVNGDWNLDIVVASTYDSGSFVFLNDGTGRFTNFANALSGIVTEDLEPMDLDGDGDLDLVALDVGPELRERFLYRIASGTFADASATVLPGDANPIAADDSAAIGVDVNGDGRLDIVIGGRGGDRLLVQQADGTFVAETATPDDTPSTLGLAAGDLDGDGRLDLVNVQGDLASADKLQLGSTVAVDDTAPVVMVEEQLGSVVNGALHAFVHDRLAPSRPHDFTRVWIEHDGIRAAFETPPAPNIETDMTWIGGALWVTPQLLGVSNYRVCARDRRDLVGCSDWVWVYAYPIHDGPFLAPDAPSGVPTQPVETQPGGCCDAGAPSSASALASLVMLGLVRRRRRR
jgi:hypothetical protein